MGVAKASTLFLCNRNHFYGSPLMGAIGSRHISRLEYDSPDAPGSHSEYEGFLLASPVLLRFINPHPHAVLTEIVLSRWILTKK